MTGHKHNQASVCLSHSLYSHTNCSAFREPSDCVTSIIPHIHQLQKCHHTVTVLLWLVQLNAWMFFFFLQIHSLSSPFSLSSLVMLPFWDWTPEAFPKDVLLDETDSSKEQLDVVSLRLRVESLCPQLGNTHRLWLFSRPRFSGLFNGDNWKVWQRKSNH